MKEHHQHPARRPDSESSHRCYQGHSLGGKHSLGDPDGDR